MRILTFTVIAGLLLPLSAFAQTEMTSPPSPPALSRSVSPVLLTAGIVGVAVVVDILTRGALSAPILRRLGLQAMPTGAAVAPRMMLRR